MLTLPRALELQSHLITHATHDGLNPVAICIANAAGVMLCAATMDNTKEPSIHTAFLKAVTAVQYRRDTITFHSHCPNGEWSDNPDGWSTVDVANAMRTNPNFVSWGGGVVIRSPLDDRIIGGVGVSNRTEAQDHELASLRPQGWLTAL